MIPNTYIYISSKPLKIFAVKVSSLISTSQAPYTQMHKIPSQPHFLIHLKAFKYTKLKKKPNHNNVDPISANIK